MADNAKAFRDFEQAGWEEESVCAKYDDPSLLVKSMTGCGIGREIDSRSYCYVIIS